MRCRLAMSNRPPHLERKRVLTGCCLEYLDLCGLSCQLVFPLATESGQPAASAGEVTPDRQKSACRDIMVISATAMILLDLCVPVVSEHC